jgi:tetratricopeptide (TPR) repeat protein
VLHDLVRGYAAGQARQVLGEAGIRAAIERSLDHYLHTVVISTGIPAPFAVAPPAPGVLPEELAGEAALQDWAGAEHQVVVQAIAQAAAAGLITRAWQIFHGGTWLVGGQGYWADIGTAGQAVLAAAEAAGDQAALGWSHLVIGWHHTFLGAGNEDRAHAARALDHWAAAATQSEQALALFRQTGDRAGQRRALAGLGECHARLGNYDLARDYARHALKVGPATDPTTLAIAWHALGFVHSRLGEPRQAIGCYRQALALVREPRNALARRMRQVLLVRFGDACRATGDLPTAVEAWQQAQQILRDQGWPESPRIRARLKQAGLPGAPGPPG